jgi:hypothetical protein
MKRRRIDVNLGELDQLLNRAVQAPLSEPDCHKIKTTLHTLVEMLPSAVRRRAARWWAPARAQQRPRSRWGLRRRRPTDMGATRRRLT